MVVDSTDGGAARAEGDPDPAEGGNSSEGGH